MKPAVIAILLFGLLGLTEGIAQGGIAGDVGLKPVEIYTFPPQEKAKPDTVKHRTALINVEAVERQLKDIEGAIQKRQKEMFDADPLIRELVGSYNGLASSINNPAFAVPDTLKKKSK